MPQRANDARAGLTFLRSRSGIDPHWLGLLGLSEGPNIAVTIAATDPSIKAIVTLAGTASPGWDIYVSQQWYFVHNDIFTDTERERLAAGLDKETILAQRTKRFRLEVEEVRWAYGGSTSWSSILALLRASCPAQR